MDWQSRWGRFEGEGGGFSRGVPGSFSFVLWGKNSTLFPFHASGHAMQMYMYIHIYLFFSICLTIRPASNRQRAKGNEHSAGIRPGEPSPTGTFHSERQAPFKFRFLLFNSPTATSSLSFHPIFASCLFACLFVCLSSFCFFAGRQLQLWDSILRFPGTFAALFAAVLAPLFCIFPSFHLSSSLSLFLRIHVKARPRTRTRSKTRTSSSHGVLGKLPLLRKQAARARPGGDGQYQTSNASFLPPCGSEKKKLTADVN